MNNPTAAAIARYELAADILQNAILQNGGNPSELAVDWAKEIVAQAMPAPMDNESSLSTSGYNKGWNDCLAEAMGELDASRAEQAGGDGCSYPSLSPDGIPEVTDETAFSVGPEETAAINAAIGKAQHPQRPDGGEWVLVPRVPTEAMLIAAGTMNNYDVDAGGRSDDDHIQWWSWMLAAAPAPPAVGEGVLIGYVSQRNINAAHQNNDVPILSRCHGENSIPVFANTATPSRCTCPSGDGSLAWPCPTHGPSHEELLASASFPEEIESLNPPSREVGECEDEGCPNSNLLHICLTGSAEQERARIVNYQLWMLDTRNGVEPPGDWKEAYSCGYAACDDDYKAGQPPSAAPRQVVDVPDEVREAIYFLSGVRVFVTSRERIKKPEGEELFDKSIATINNWIAQPAPGVVDEVVERVCRVAFIDWDSCSDSNKADLRALILRAIRPGG